MEYVKLNELCDINIGKTPSRSNPKYWENNGNKWLAISDLKSKYILESKEKITNLAIEENNMKLVPKDTVVMSFKLSIGKVAILKEDMYTNEAIANFQIKNKEIITSEYLYYALKTLNFDNVDRAVMGATLNKKKLNDIKILYCDIGIQNKIVNVLNKAQDLIDKKKEQIRMLDELVKSRFVEMFGDPSKNKKGWDIYEIDEYLECLTDYHSNGSYESLRDNVTLLDSPNYALMVRTTDLENNNFEKDVKYIDEHAYNYLEKSKVFGGEIIINKIGSAGKVYLMPFLNKPVSLAMNQFLLRFDQNKVNHIFLYNLLSTPYMEIKIKEKVRGAVTKTITKDAIRKINIIVPPIEVQNQFADFVKQVDKLKFDSKKSYNLMELPIYKRPSMLYDIIIL